jgi:hypothetical protein
MFESLASANDFISKSLNIRKLNFKKLHSCNRTKINVVYLYKDSDDDNNNNNNNNNNDNNTTTTTTTNNSKNVNRIKCQPIKGVGGRSTMEY